MAEAARRAGSLKAFIELTAPVFSSMGGAPADFQPRPTDVIIGPYGKCGTTWLQQMFHTLRTRGDSDYDDISRVVPWLETAPALGIDLNAEQRAEPRGFKSHLSWDATPRGTRCIVSIRDPRDAAFSMFKFMEGWMFEPGAIDPNDFIKLQYFERPVEHGYWHHLASWWEHRGDDNVLLLSYESMKADHAGTIRRVADFCGIELDDELLQITLDNSSLDFMLKHKDKFDDLLMREMTEKAMNLPTGSDSAKVREGKVGSHANILSDEVAALFESRWQAEITSRFGFRSYGEMEAQLRAELAG